LTGEGYPKQKEPGTRCQKKKKKTSNNHSFNTPGPQKKKAFVCGEKKPEITGHRKQKKDIKEKTNQNPPEGLMGGMGGRGKILPSAGGGENWRERGETGKTIPVEKREGYPKNLILERAGLAGEKREKKRCGRKGKSMGKTEFLPQSRLQQKS